MAEALQPATIEALLNEVRRFPPSPEIAAAAVMRDPGIYERAERDPEGFWAELARERLSWSKPFSRVLDWQLPFARWFEDGELNVAHNCLDRHIEAGLGERIAYIWEGEPGEQRRITYRELLDEVQRAANALKSMGVRRGDRVAIYLPMVPELPVAMLACARLGAAHTVVFGGFSAEALAGRIQDAGAVICITADGSYRGGKVVPLKANTDAAVSQCPTIKHVLVVRRTGEAVAMTAARDVWWHERVAAQAADCPCEPMSAEDLLYILYTSGTTAKPKGIMHTTAGYLLGTSVTHQWIFDLRPDDIWWCAADIGWVTGHSYIVYGPLCNAATGVLYEGTPGYPDKDRWWDIIERLGVTKLYCAPTAIRTFMKWGAEWPGKHDLSSLRLLGSVGEPINPEAWMWYREHIGGGRTPVVDTWWQTETGMIMISPLPGLTTLKPGSATRPFPGISAEVVDEAGDPVGPGAGGYLVLTRPWPSMLRGIWGDPERYQQVYWSRYEGRYFTGDGARRDQDSDFWLLGRVDDVMNVSGHRISTIEVESALVDHPAVAEAAVVGREDSITGQAIVAYVTLRGGDEGDADLAGVLREHVKAKIGGMAKPAAIVFTPELPKTRSGKIMRRLLRDIAEHRKLGDVTTLADASVVEEIRARAPDEETKEG